MLKKPAWATGQSAPPNEQGWLESAESLIPQSIWKSALSIPILFLLALPLFAVLSLTLFYYGLVSASTLQQSIERVVNSIPYGIAGFWVLAFVVFVPWSLTVCTVEHWVSSSLE